MLFLLFLLAVALYIVTYFRKVKLQGKYPGKYAVVLGGTGSLGTSFCRRLLKEGYSLIVSGRTLQSIEALKEKLGDSDNKVLPFPYDASQTTMGEFNIKFNAILQQHSICPKEVALVVIAAGFGEYNKFEDTTIEHKLSLLSCGLSFPIEASDYFYKLFCERYIQNRNASAIIYISSCLAFYPGPNFAIYHAAKAGLSALSSSLYIEATKYKTDVIAVHPGTIRNSEFFKRPEMHFDSLPKCRKWGHTKLLSVTAAQVTEETFKYLGLCAHVHVGATSWLTILLYSLIPRSIMCWALRKK